MSAFMRCLSCRHLMMHHDVAEASGDDPICCVDGCQCPPRRLTEMQLVAYRASMSSEQVAHYHLQTDLSVAMVKRRLRGNWLDRYRTRRDMRAYRRWEQRRATLRA
jgi:hypothetical protein